MKKHIPNTLTSLNLFSGSIATVMAFQGEYTWVVVWVIIAALFDFSDGFAARLLKAYSPIGKELDSLADMVSFGLAPSIAAFRFLSDNTIRISQNPIIVEYLPYMAFLLAIFSALRLAKFNVDERQSESFIGLNTPALIITNWQTFYKNIVLLICSVIVFLYCERISNWFTGKTYWLAFLYIFIFIGLFTFRNYLYDPLFDFRPYKIGANGLVNPNRVNECVI